MRLYVLLLLLMLWLLMLWLRMLLMLLLLLHATGRVLAQELERYPCSSMSVVLAAKACPIGLT